MKFIVQNPEEKKKLLHLSGPLSYLFGQNQPHAIFFPKSVVFFDTGKSF